MVPQGKPLTLPEFQNGFLPLVAGVVVAIGLSLFLKETGHARVADRPSRATPPSPTLAAT